MARTTERASDRAYATLRDEILEWSLAPGSLLGEVEQSTRLGISRTPLREALARLAADGLVSTQSGRGLVVTDATTDSVRELFELREPLETAAAGLAARRRDPVVFAALAEEFAHADGLLTEPSRRAYYDLVRRFDAAIDASIDNAYLVSALEGVRTHLARIRRLSHDDPDRLIAAAAEHLLISEAIRDGDADLARYATHVHLHRSLTHILHSKGT